MKTKSIKCKEVFILYNEAEFEADDEMQILFTNDIEALEDRLTDIIVAMGLPEEQTNAVLSLINDSMAGHHVNILDTHETACEY